MSGVSVSGETVRYQQTKNHQREETEDEEKEQQRTRREGKDETQAGSIQVSVGQPQWSGPEKGNDVGCKSCRSQAHHGCSPDPLHVWLPIAAILLLPLLPLCLYMVVFPITDGSKVITTITMMWKSSHLKIILQRYMQQCTNGHVGVQYVCVCMCV